MRENKVRHTVGITVSSEDSGFNSFLSDVKRKGQLSKLIGDLLRYYYKTPSVQDGLQDFLLKEDEFYANIQTAFGDIISEHQRRGSQVSMGDLTQAQMMQMMVDMSEHMQRVNTSPVYIQQVNPTAYGGAGQPMMGQPMMAQPVPQELQYVQPLQMQQPVMAQPVPQEVPYAPQELQQQVQAQQPVSGTAPQEVQSQQDVQSVTTHDKGYNDTKELPTYAHMEVNPPQEVNPMAGLFDADEEVEETIEDTDKPKAPPSLARLKKSITKG